MKTADAGAFALSAILFCPLITLGEQTNRRAADGKADLVTTNSVPLSAYQAAWDTHLAVKTQDPEINEWKFRIRLAHDPLNGEAMRGLIQQLYANGETTLSLAAAQYAARSGDTRLHINAVEINRAVRELLQPYADPDTKADIFDETQHDVLRDKLGAAKKQPPTLDTYKEMERDMRTLLEDSTFKRDPLILLTHYYHHRQDWSMAVMTAMLVLRLEPEHPEMLTICLDVLSKSGFEPMQTLMIKFYATRDDLSLPLIEAFIILCKRLEMQKETRAFREKAAQLDPENPAHWQEIGEIFFAQRQYKEAIRHLDKATRLPGHDVSIYHTLALVLHRSGDRRNMIYWLRRWKDVVDKELLERTLQNRPFNQYPNVLEEL